MIQRGLRLVLIAGLVSTTGWGQERSPRPAEAPADTPPHTATAATSRPATAPATQPTSPIPAVDYGGDLEHRPALTGDWRGGRNWMSEHGIRFDAEVIQYLQGNAYGGHSTDGALEYSGTADYSVFFDFQRLGLWPGGFAKLRAETKFGHSVNPDVGSVSPANINALLPQPGPPGLTTLTEYWIMQYVSEKLGFIAGQVDLTALPRQNVFASDRYQHFLNTSFWQNPVAFTTVPYSTMTVGAFYSPTKWLHGATLVVDAYGTAAHSGFYEASHAPQAASVIQALSINIKPFGLPGTQRFNFSYSHRPRYALEDIDRLLLAGIASPEFDRLRLPHTLIVGGRPWRVRNAAIRSALSYLLEPDREASSWAFWYDFDQYVYTEVDDPNQGWGVFGRFGWSPGETNPVESFYSLGVGGRGVIPKRDQDRFGIGYYMLNLTNDLPGLMNANAEQGVEMFYNIEITPWMHITPDLQIIIHPGGDTGERARDPAIVYGLRMQMRF